MTRKNINTKRSGLLCTRQLLALLLAVVMMTGTAMTFAACGNKAEETEVDLTETETISAYDETTADDSEEATGEVSEENAEEATDEDAESSTGEDESGTEDEEGTSVLDDTTKAVDVTETEEETADANGYTYTAMSDAIMYVKKQVNVRSIPSQDGEKLGSLSAGTPVTVTGQCNETGWYRIAFNGGTGYVSNNYLTDDKSEVETTTQASTTTKSSSETTTTTKKSTETTTTTKNTENTTTKKTSYSTMTEKYEAEGLENFTAAELVTLCEEYAEEVVRLVNVERAKEDLVALKENSLLMEAAQIRAEELATSFSHTRPDGTSCFTTFREVGFLSTRGGENIAYGQMTPASVMSEWMASAGHEGNIMDATYIIDTTTFEVTYVNYYVDDQGDGYIGGGYDSIGVGVYYDASSYTFYWVQLFGRSHTHQWEDGMVDGVDCLTCFATNCGAHKWADGSITDEMSWID